MKPAKVKSRAPVELPHNYEAEQALLAAILAKNTCIDDVQEFIEPEYFAEPVHGRIFAACRDCIMRGEAANAVTLKHLFQNDEALKTVGGASYLAELQGNFVSIIGAPDYARSVRDYYFRRELILLLNEYVDLLHNQPGKGPLEQMESLEAELGGLVAGRTGVGEPQPFLASIDASLRQSEAVLNGDGGLLGLGTGFGRLDNIMGGFEPGQLYIIAGRPSMGKTAFGLSMALAAAQEGNPVLVLSLEMSHQQLATRALANATGIPFSAQTRGPLDRLGWTQLTDTRAQWANLPLFIDDEAGITPQKALMKARAVRRKHGLSAIFIDYLQLMRGGARFNNRVEEVTFITQELKRIAKVLEVPVIAMAQLSRALEAREDKRPHLSDLRESGSIEQDADCVMFIFREDYYLERERPQRSQRDDDQRFSAKLLAYEDALSRCAGLAEIIIAKQRNGALGSVTLAFDGRTMAFKDREAA